MPSSTMSARVISAKYSGTENGKLKKIWLSSREMALNCARRVATFARDSPPRSAATPPPATPPAAPTAPAPARCCSAASLPLLKMCVSGGSSSALSTSRGKKRSATASSTRAATSPRIRCTSAEVSARESKASISAQRPKSMSTSLPAASTSRLPGCGSEWKYPTTRSCARKQSTPIGMSALIVDADDLASCSPSIHSLTRTLRVVRSWWHFGMYTLPLSIGKSVSVKRCMLAASCL
mmetsp:Transcript_40096/g.84094  ORF Transcript_40096/g.84094 Transcript_40096/m.84094 type:complete len:237 (-) Transcript_40096:861-1571(-)